MRNRVSDLAVTTPPEAGASIEPVGRMLERQHHPWRGRSGDLWRHKRSPCEARPALVFAIKNHERIPVALEFGSVFPPDVVEVRHMPSKYVLSPSVSAVPSPVAKQDHPRRSYEPRARWEPLRRNLAYSRRAPRR
jgi:hypothetical protein